MRMAGSMGGRLELRINDAYDSEFDRKVMEQIPKDANGRGITGTRSSALLFQTALPVLEVPDAAADDSAQHDAHRRGPRQVGRPQRHQGRGPARAS